MIQSKIITPSDGYHYFFGYYDLQPYSSDGNRHLCHRVGFIDRLPTEEDTAEIGYIDIDSKSFVHLATTHSWNFQQGTLLQWFERDKTVVFNDFDGNKHVARVVNMNGQEVRRYDMPFAALDVKNGRAISINFSRIYDFRPGYGYPNIKDPGADVSLPENDGIFSVDLNSGESKLLYSYKDFAEAFHEEPFTSAKLVVNHVNFSPLGTKFVFLLRNFGGESRVWRTLLAAGDLQGNLRALTKFEINSHYSFKDETTLMIYSGLPELGIYFINTDTGERQRLYNDVCDPWDIHCNYSPDRNSFIADGYPGNDKKRPVYLYDFNTKEAKELFRVPSLPSETDLRCDLHVRWFDDGKRISYDTTENGCRQIAEVVL